MHMPQPFIAETARLNSSNSSLATPCEPMKFIRNRAGIGHWLIGSVDFTLMGALLIGSIPGIILGSMVATRASDTLLRPVLAITLLLVSVKLLLAPNYPVPVATALFALAIPATYLWSNPQLEPVD